MLRESKQNKKEDKEIQKIISDLNITFKENRIESLISKCEFSYDDLAKIFGYGNRSQINQLFNKKSFTPDELYRISRFFNVSVDYLLGFEDEKHPGNKEFSNYTGLNEESIELLRTLNQEKPIDKENKGSKENELIYSHTRKTADFINYALSHYSERYMPLDSDYKQTESNNYTKYIYTIFELLWDYIDISNILYKNSSDNKTIDNIVTINGGIEDDIQFNPHELHKERIIYMLRNCLDNLEMNKSSNETAIKYPTPMI